MTLIPRSLRRGLLALLPLTLSFQVLAAAPQLADFQAKAVRAKLVLALHDYPVTPEAMRTQAENTMKAADAALTALAAQDPAKLNFTNTFAAYDAITAQVGEMYQLVGTVAESSIDAAMRETGNELSVKLQEWSVGLDYREDIYRVLKAVADGKPKLDAQEQRLVNELMRNYRRAGLALAPAERAEVEKLNTQFSININEARAPLDFTAEELTGLPQSFFDSPGVKQPDGRFRVLAHVTWHHQAVAESADNADVRRKVLTARYRLAREKNTPVLSKLVALRADIARRLGYASWADYQTETRMVGSGTAAMKFEGELVAGLQPKFEAEMETLRLLKVAQTGQADAKLELSDVAYYTNRLKKEKYAVDTEALRVYFPYQPTLEGMFAIYQKIFGLKFTQVEPPYVWAAGVQLYVVEDAASGAPIGAFYLDMFPREGKFNHFACFPQKNGRVLPDGRYELPVAALMCNFPIPSADKPSLLPHSDVRTLFHEFGHVMHAMLSRSRFVAQTGFAVPQDFVEAPSQMLESWVWDKAVLDTFAADYRDPAKKIPAETIAALVAARQATEGYFTRRQLAIGSLDLNLHSLSSEAAWLADIEKIVNDTTAAITLPTPARCPM
jgi:thimet oligopeptidase